LTRSQQRQLRDLAVALLAAADTPYAAIQQKALERSLK